MPPLPSTLILATGNPHKVEELRAIFAAVEGAGGANTINVLGLGDLPFHTHLREPEEHGTTFEENARIKALSYAMQITRHAGTQANRHEVPDSDLRASVPLASVPSSFLCLADDSGLEIDALSGRPGVISSHYCTDGKDTDPPMTRPERDAANNARVLRELEGVAFEQRTARFVCCMCLVGGARVSGLGVRVSGPEDADGDASAFTRNPNPESRDPTPRPSVLHQTRGTFEGRIGVPPRIPAGNNGFGYDPLFLVAPTYTHTGAELPTETKNHLSHRGAAARAMAQWIQSQRA